jgi:hypothetical protein
MNLEIINPKSEILNSKQITNPSRTEIKISSGIPLLRENPNVPNSRVWNLENWNLVFVWDLDIGISDLYYLSLKL